MNLGKATIAMVLALLCCSVGAFAASSDATLSGVVMDAQGTPQMGALIQLLSADATAVATAFTDSRGRYIMPAVLPGRYRVRASAAFFAPSTHEGIRLRSGGQAIVNLTLTSLFELSNWFPTQARRADEPSDDWKWTLRSAASRPVLRMTDHSGGQAEDMEVSSSAETSSKQFTQTRLQITGGDGALGHGGTHQRMVFNRTMEDDDSALVMLDVGEPQLPFSGQPSTTGSAGYERRSPLGGSTRVMASFASHPELSTGAAQGFSSMQVASAERIVLGDLVRIDAGTLMLAERLAASRIFTAPFIAADVQISPNVTVTVRYAEARELQSADDLDRVEPEILALSAADGKPVNPFGRHGELEINDKLTERTRVQLAAYAGEVASGGIAGSGILTPADFAASAVLVDPSTQTFRLTQDGYRDRGVSAVLLHQLSPVLTASLAFDFGEALEREATAPTQLHNLRSSVTTSLEPAVSAALKGHVACTGTAVRAQYRWQPRRTVSQVNSYNASRDDAYLSLYLRQRLHLGRLLPQGLDAVIEATNLLEEGYQPVVASDGSTLFLAQVPRSVQGGFSFTF